MAKETFLFPVVYKGEPKSEHAAKTITVPGSPDPVLFLSGPDFDLPYAYVTEKQGRYLRRIAPKLFDFPNGLHAKSDTDDLTARIEALEATVANLIDRLGDMATGTPQSAKRNPRGKGTAPMADPLVALAGPALLVGSPAPTEFAGVDL